DSAGRKEGRAFVADFSCLERSVLRAGIDVARRWRRTKGRPVIKIKCSSRHLQRASARYCASSPTDCRARYGWLNNSMGGNQMLRVLAAVAALAVGATVVMAQNAALIEQRKAAMKAFGGAAKGPGLMAKGDAPFNADTVKASLKTIEDT